MFFDEGQYLLGSAAFPSTTHMVSPYNPTEGIPNPDTQEKRFNDSITSTRVSIDHTFGMLKTRFQSLSGLRTRIGGDKDFRRTMLWVDTCVILHNWLRGRSEEDDFWTVWEDPKTFEAKWKEEADERGRDQPSRSERLSMSQSERRLAASFGDGQRWCKRNCRKERLRHSILISYGFIYLYHSPTL